MSLALLEGLVLFVASAGMTLLSRRPLPVDWLDAAVMMAQATAFTLCCLVAFYYNDLYDFGIVRNFRGFASRLLEALGVTMILLAGFDTLFADTRLADGPFFSSLLLILGLLVPLRAIGYGIMRRGTFADRVLIIGTDSLARTLIEEIDSRPYLGYQIVGVVGDGPGPNELPLRYPLLGPLQHLAKIAEQAQAERIIVATNERRGIPMSQLLEAGARGILVEDGLQTYEYFTKKLAIEALRPSLLVFSGCPKETRLQCQRLVSLVVAAAGLLLTAPLMTLIALAVKLDSRGPVLFVHDRVGLHGRRFRLLKFRTMVPAEGTTSEWVQDNEARITRAGWWLRKYRLDELPQFVNILRGDMNLVGPRPHPVSNFALFAERIPYYVLRASVRPGVTGWAQIRHGYANTLEEEIEKMRYDLYYIQHLSFWFDLRILVDTVKIVLFGRGSQAADAYAPETLVAGRPTPFLLRHLEGRSLEVFSRDG